MYFIIVGPKIKKNGQDDGRGSDSKRQAASATRKAEVATGNNSVVNANARRQKIARGSKED